MFLLISQPLDQSEDFHTRSWSIRLPKNRHSSFYFPSYTVRGQLSSMAYQVAAWQGSFQASITSLQPLSSQSAIFCISSPSDLEKDFDRYVFFLSFFLQWLLLLITDINLLILGQCVLSILRLIWGWLVADLRPRTVPCTAYNFEHWKGRTHPWHRRTLFTRNHLLHPVVPTPRGTQFLTWSQSTWSVREHDLGGLVL